MDTDIRPMQDDDIEELVRLSLLAWTPIFASFEQLLGPEIFRAVWPDWKATQGGGVEKACQDREKFTVLVAVAEGRPVGFLAYQLHAQEAIGEIHLLAVHPDYSNRGIGTELNKLALAKMKEAGMKLASVSTGGDASHAPARRCYEKAGFAAFVPSVYYYQSL